MESLNRVSSPTTVASSTPSSTGANATASNKIIYSAPASPASPTPAENAATPAASVTTAGISNNSSAASPTAVLPSATSGYSNGSASSHNASYSTASTPLPTAMQTRSAQLLNGLTPLSTPKKNFLDAVTLKTIREKLKTPGGACEIQSMRLEFSEQPVNVIKDRYLISSQPSHISAAAAAKTPASYRHLIDLTCSNLKCTDIYTEQQYLCKIINEPLHKVQRAYFQLQQESELCHSTIYGHSLIRAVHDIVPLSKQRTYIIIASTPEAEQVCDMDLDYAANAECLDDLVDDDDEEERGIIYEDLHTYIRNKRRLSECEARALFHQICQTVQVCHSNGIILRDLKLKRFYFINKARTKLQYESLEGSMILDDPNDDTLSDKIGCPLYTAPELLCPHPTYQGKPADMWSLGVILYTMLVGQYPFYEKGNCNLITIIRHCQVQIPSTLTRSVRWLLLMLLRKNYEERLQAEHIFDTPWLREQRPFYMYIPVDIVIPDDELETEEVEDEQRNPSNAADKIPECSGLQEEFTSVEPLDYSTRSTNLQMDCVNADNDAEAAGSNNTVIVNVNTDDTEDVDMG